MLGGLGNLAGIMKTAKNLQDNLQKIQSELASRRFQAEAGGGMVVATVDGKLALVDIKIDPQASRDVELLEDLVKSAIGDAMKKAQEAVKAEMSSLTGGLNIPGLSEMIGGA